MKRFGLLGAALLVAFACCACATSTPGSRRADAMPAPGRIALAGTTLTFGVPAGWSDRNTTSCGDTPCLSIHLVPDEDGISTMFPDLRVRRVLTEATEGAPLELATREVSHLARVAELVKAPTPIEIAGQVGRGRPNEAGREPRNVIQAT